MSVTQNELNKRRKKRYAIDIAYRNKCIIRAKEYNAKNRELVLKKQRETAKKNYAFCPDKIKQSTKKWYLKNRDRILKETYLRRDNPIEKQRHKIYQRKWAQLNEKKVSSYSLNWLKKNKHRFDLKLNRKIRSSINLCMKGKKKRIGKLNIDFDKVKVHLENNFSSDMSWSNYGKFWQIDHIVPLSWFKTQEQLLNKGWALDNLQPLESSINLEKSNKYVAKREQLVSKDVIFL